MRKFGHCPPEGCSWERARQDAHLGSIQQEWLTGVVDRLESFYIMQPGSSHVRWDCRGEDAWKKGGGLLKTFLQRLHRGEGLSQDQLNKAASACLNSCSRSGPNIIHPDLGLKKGRWTRDNTPWKWPSRALLRCSSPHLASK